MKKLFYLLTMLLLAMAPVVSAHTMWIEVAQTGRKGKAQEVKVFFGDYSWEKPTATAKWFSDIVDYKLMMQAPDGTITELKEKMQDSFYYASSFVPNEDGVYHFWFSHEVKGIHRDKKLTYASAAFVNVNAKKESSVLMQQFETGLSVKNLKKPNEIIFLEKGKPAANQVITLVKEHAKGEVFTVNTDSDGRLIFPKDWTGNYLLEFTHSTKVPEAMHHGAAYQYDYKEFSYRIRL